MNVKKCKLIMIYIFVIIFCSGCQKTPEKAAVVSHTNGFDKSLIAEKLPENEKRKVDLPEHWVVKGERGENAMVQLSADIKTDPIYIRNTPVIEIVPSEFEKETLQKFIDFFVSGEELLEKKQQTKEELKEQIAFIKKRIDNKEGDYGNSDNRAGAEEYLKIQEEKMNEAPDIVEEQKKEAVEFDKDSLFKADIGLNREATISASNYNREGGTYSSFSYMKGKMNYGEELKYYQEMNNFWVEYNGENSFAGTSMIDVMEVYENALNKKGIDFDQGKKEAEQFLKNLGITNMEFVSEDKIAWFSNSDYPKYFYPIDNWFLADWSKSKSGYEYKFAPSVNGIIIDALLDNYGDKDTPEESYAPPFKVESISVSITEDGIVAFTWNNMAKKVEVIAENTKLLPFESIQERLFDHLFYVIGAPPGIPTKYKFEIENVNLRYTYVQAYGNPDHAWLVPAWFFTAKEYVDDSKGSGMEYENNTRIVMLNALEGGYIKKVFK